METKKCTCCDLEFPKTEDYFFAKVVKQQNKIGLAIYYSFKSICKKCHGKKGEENRIKKRCLEMNCNVLEYEKKWKEQYSATRKKYDLINFKTVSRYHSKELTDYYIAQRFRLNIKEIPKEIIETKRLILQLKRELKTI